MEDFADRSQPIGLYQQKPGLEIPGRLQEATHGGGCCGCPPGGQPVESVALLVGFGTGPINVLQSGKRLVLNNGFHRVVAMRMAGITHIPVVVQHVAKPAIEFPDVDSAYLGTIS